jgi:hypothetical protein
MRKQNIDSAKIPIIWVDETNKSAHSIFNANDWSDRSKAIMSSCAAQLSLLEYQAAKLPSIVQYSRKICEVRFKDLKAQWDKSAWNISECDYFVEVPEFHLNIQAFLATIKVFLDLIVQLISSEGIVDTVIQGFHKKGEDIGGRLISILENNAKQGKTVTASKLLMLIGEQKTTWIDQAVGIRDLLVHPNQGMSQIMFRMEIRHKRNGELKLERVIQPLFSGLQLDQYAQITLMSVEGFSKNFLEIIKAA